jgi:asparagine synthase (glutamine-hydrolysing)
MCRIYGHFNAVVASTQLRTVAALQRHGGPDAHGRTRGDGWSLGSNRLAIMDPAGGRQPYENEGGTIKVVFNGEIYNHSDLRGRLRDRGFRCADCCDGSILPDLYELYGDRFPEHLDGMYAAAVLDLRGEPRLVLVTDHLGMKPLYYSWDARRGKLYFSSEIPSLLAFDAVSSSIWGPGLRDYLTTKTPFGEQTMFADVRVLPPASTASCDRRSGLRVARRQLPAPAARRPSPAAGDRAALEVRAALREEVRRLLVADVPVAAITSGGLDSSLVTALAAGQAPGLHTFNIGYRGGWPGDERDYARQVAARAGATYHQVEIDPLTFPDLLPDVAWHLGQPNADPIALSTHALFAAVRGAGFKVALTGDAADEVFGGYERMRAAAAAAAAGRPWYQSYLDSLAVLPAVQRAQLYTDDYLAELDAADPAIPPEATDALCRGSGTVLDRITAFELSWRLPAYHLRRVDHLSMASGVEVRLPFCQRRVIELGRGLPDELRISGDQVKRTLYASCAGLLPASVLGRPKQPFTLPIAAMLAPGWPLWDFAQDLLASTRLRAAGQVKPHAVRALFAAQASRPDSATALTIWALSLYELWCEESGARARRSLAETEMVGT